MSTSLTTLVNPGEFYQIANTGEDYVAKNASAVTMQLIHRATKPANGEMGNPISPGAQMNRDPAAPDAAWVSAPSAGARVSVEKI